MAQGNLPGTAAITPSTKTLGEFLGDVAAIVGAQDNPGEVRALSAIHRSLDWIQNHDWESLLRTGSTFNSVVGTATYTPGQRFRKMHSLRVSSGNERKLWFIRKEEYDERISRQSTRGLPWFYTMYQMGDNGVITLLPTPDQAETFIYTYYRDIARPTNEALTLGDSFPREWEDMLVSRAQYYVAIGRGLRTDRLAMLRQDSELAKQDALMRDTSEHDENIVMQSGNGTSLFDPLVGRDDPSLWW
jgi:hypothetical protein